MLQKEAFVVIDTTLLSIMLPNDRSINTRPKAALQLDEPDALRIKTACDAAGLPYPKVSNTFGPDGVLWASTTRAGIMAVQDGIVTSLIATGGAHLRGKAFLRLAMWDDFRCQIAPHCYSTLLRLDIHAVEDIEQQAYRRNKEAQIQRENEVAL
jgi:hypothetical protein